MLSIVTGFVFHPGHDAWHGQTVVIYTQGARTIVGRWDAVQEGKVLVRDAAVHEDPSTREAWVARLREYGVPVEHRILRFPESEVARVVRLRDA
jgi:hypothetical protein